MTKNQKHYVGLDTHKHYVMVGAVNAAQEVVLPPRKVSLIEFEGWAKKHLGWTAEVGLEATTNAWYFYDLLEPLVARVVVCHAPQVKLIAAAFVKTDKKDTMTPSTGLRTGLAKLLAVGMIPAAGVPPAYVRELRALINHRQRLISQQTRSKNRLRSLLQRQPIVPPGGELFASANRAWWSKLELSPSEKGGFNFLGFNIRQYPVNKPYTRTCRSRPGFKTIIKPAIKRHLYQLKQLVRQYRGSPQAALMGVLNPIIRGGTPSYQSCAAKKTFDRLDKERYWKLAKWANFRHPHKLWGWQYRCYWRRHPARIDFSDGELTLIQHHHTPIERHIKIKGDKSPFDGDWPYWTTRLGKDPTRPKRITVLMKRQQGKWAEWGLRLRPTDVLEVHHRDAHHHNQHYQNLALLPGHCPDNVHRSSVPVIRTT